MPIPIHQKYHSRVPECAIEKILCKSRIWFELVVIPIYIQYGLVLEPPLSTLTIKEFEANVANGIVTSFIVALLQFPVANGRDRNDEGKLINYYSLSFVQNDFGPTKSFWSGANSKLFWSGPNNFVQLGSNETFLV